MYKPKNTAYMKGHAWKGFHMVAHWIVTIHIHVQRQKECGTRPILEIPPILTAFGPCCAPLVSFYAKVKGMRACLPWSSTSPSGLLLLLVDVWQETTVCLVAVWYAPSSGQIAQKRRSVKLLFV